MAFNRNNNTGLSRAINDLPDVSANRIEELYNEYNDRPSLTGTVVWYWGMVLGYGTGVWYCRMVLGYAAEVWQGCSQDLKGGGVPDAKPCVLLGRFTGMLPRLSLSLLEHVLCEYT